MSNRLGRPLGSKNKRAAAAGGRETQSLANQKTAARNKGPREARKARKRSSIHIENQVTLSPRPIIATQSIAGPASVPSDNSSSPKSNGQSPFTDVNSMSWATSPFEFSLPFTEDKWGLQEDFASTDMTRGLFHHEETTLSKCINEPGRESVQYSQPTSTLRCFDLHMPPAANEFALQIKRLRGL
ncbi:hypothetical protein TsFJ059_008055 [Trichoderma semiorbis]|uniref:Uncharacterized protein n=1 Tax=Trichoderma semiorbis TaxID=1491008 RepID=A0A9P8KM57_9HYPO|nr:hypothetical protein TsFJ059_008055 [Trichoderma semiorbis]